MKKVEGWSQLRALWESAGVWHNDKGEPEIVDYARGPFMKYMQPHEWVEFMAITKNAVEMVKRGDVERKYLGVLHTWISRGRWMEPKWDVTANDQLPDLDGRIKLVLP